MNLDWEIHSTRTPLSDRARPEITISQHTAVLGTDSLSLYVALKSGSLIRIYLPAVTSYPDLKQELAYLLLGGSFCSTKYLSTEEISSTFKSLTLQT